MKRFAVIDADTGEILRHGSCSRRSLWLQASGDSELVVVADVNDVEHYFDLATRTFRVRPVFPEPSALTVTAGGSVTFTGLPPCQARVDRGDWVDIDDGELVLEFPGPGLYRLDLQGFPYRPLRHYIEVQDEDVGSQEA